MKKGIILLIASVLLFVSIPAFAATAQQTNAVIVSSVSFRSGPSTSSNVMKYLKAGETVSVLEKTNSYWLKVQDGKGIVGYVSSNDKYISYKEPRTGPDRFKCDRRIVGILPQRAFYKWSAHPVFSKRMSGSR